MGSGAFIGMIIGAIASLSFWPSPVSAVVGAVLGGIIGNEIERIKKRT